MTLIFCQLQKFTVQFLTVYIGCIQKEDWEALFLKETEILVIFLFENEDEAHCGGEYYPTGPVSPTGVQQRPQHTIHIILILTPFSDPLWMSTAIQEKTTPIRL